MVTSEASGRSTRYATPEVRASKAVTSRDRGSLGGDVSRPWCSGHQRTISRFLKRMFIRHQVESGVPFNADRSLRMGIVIESVGLRDASASDFRLESLFVYVTYADRQAGVHLRAGSYDQHGSAASTSEARRHKHYARPGHVSFGESSNKPFTTPVESFGRLGREGCEFIDELATSVVGGRGGGPRAKKGIRTELFLQIGSVTSQVAISRRIHWYELEFRGRQEAKGRGEVGGLMPMTWSWHIDAG